jgi:aspartate kinase
MENVVVSGVSLNEKEAKITMVGLPDRPGVAAQIFETISDENIVVDMIIQNIGEHGHSDISFTVPEGELKKAVEVGEALRNDLGAKEIRADGDIAKVSAVGVGMRSHSGVAAKMFKSLAEEGINILMISTSEIKISCVVDADRGHDALRALHSAFDLDKEETTVED